MAVMPAEDKAQQATRAAFHGWITAPPYEKSTERFGHVGAWPGGYRDYSVQLAWEAWQEASKRAKAVK